MNDSGSHPYPDEELWLRLTDRQRAVFDLLLERKTSKEIARALAISKDTVDQRVKAVRQALGAANRNEAALIYARLRSTYDRVAYDPAVMANPPTLAPFDFPDDGPTNALTLRDGAGTAAQSKCFGPAFKDLGRHDHSAANRAWIYLTVITVLVFLALGGLGIAEALTQLVSR